MKRTSLLWLLGALIASGAPPSTEDQRVPILLNKPDRLQTTRWPVSFGVPFKPGECRDVRTLGIVDEAGAVVPSQFVKTAGAADGSVRWALGDFVADFSKKYYLALQAPAAERAKGEIDLQRTGDDRIAVTTGVARYEFRKDAPGLLAIALDVNRDGKFGADEILVAGNAGGFTVLDSTGAAGVLHCDRLRVELAGPRHTVIAVEGDYLDAKGARLAAAVVYFHFYAGCDQIRISHKFIVTEDSNQRWFKDIGLTLRTKLTGPSTATFDHDIPRASVSELLQGSSRVTMLQDDFPHFGSAKSQSYIVVHRNGSIEKPLASGTACGDWADVSSPRWGLAAQVPGFAEQFPKALIASADELTIKLWAAESGHELDYRTPEIIKNYFGHDWIPADNPIVKAPNTAQGTSKTHELWLYPHAGALTPGIAAGFGATREEIFACIDPGWLARSEAFGPIHPKDPARFPEAEAAITDHFDRGVLAGDKVFPGTGYLYWGMYPYSAQPWELKDGHWYPTIHRLARCLEYNLKRGTWILYARSGERKYYDYARRYTRLLGNLQFSSWDSVSKPKGWMVMGQFHSPIVWGHYAPRDKHPTMDSEGACLSFASSEDIIQFVYDYFLTGDYHSRDLALMWKEAMFKEMNSDVDKALGFYPPSAFFRVLGSAYELDHDPRVLDYGSKIMQRLVATDGPVDILNPQIDHNYGKEGEVFSGFYYYYIATGDPLAKRALVQLAQFRYRHGQLDHFFSRASSLLQAFALAYRETKEPIYAAYLAQVVGDFGRNWQTMEKIGVDFSKLNQQTKTPWGQLVLTHQGTIHVGVPVAEQIVSEYQGSRPYLPFAVKSSPTQRTYVYLNKEKPGAAMLDVFVNNWGDRSVAPRLLNAGGQPVPLEFVERDFMRVTKPDCYNAHNIWYLTYEDQIFFRLRIPASVDPGIYQLDVGSEVEFTLLNSDVEKVLQVAPDGLVVLPGHRYYFDVPPNLAAVEYFASRPVNLFDPAGKTVASEALGKGRYRFQTGGQSGSWALETGRDKFLGDLSEGVEAFVKIVSPKFPLTIALGDSKRLFKVASGGPNENSSAAGAPDKAFDQSRPGFGQAIRLNNQIVQVAAADAPPPRERGTVEFWLQPQWSATDSHLETVSDSTTRLALFRADPITVGYNIDPDNLGRTGRYNTGQLGLGVQKAGTSKAGVFLEAGKWYHIAVTWDVNGTDSNCDIFINGRKKAYNHYVEGMAKDALISKLLPPGTDVRFGSGRISGKVATGELYDELRVSRTVRYHDDFDVPTAPFTSDAGTYLLMHFDGNLDGVQNAMPITGKLTRGKM